MMRDNMGLFRGRRVDSSGWWVEGYLAKGKSWKTGGLTPHIMTEIDGRLVLSEVDPSTVGEFTGLLDKNGVKMFEGDIIRDADTGNFREVIWNTPAFVLADKERRFYWTYHTEDYEVVGNRWDNAELLEAAP